MIRFLYEANLWNIERLQNFYRGPVGFSDHTEDAFAAQLAIAKGACVIEKHLVLDN
jgi:sialic acid synthase SpsE